jgi:isoleucyl-tRNA synthetase
MDYRATLNLPKTAFKMKANLSQQEPKALQRWQNEGLYDLVQRHSEGRPLFVLHDGPPYANGKIHLGTAFNKILKDIILRSKRADGFNAPYIPGWDCHGLPIEHNVDKELGEKKQTIPILSKRRACRKYAEKWIKTQKDEFKRLGVLGDWDNPYLTMSYDYEATIAREFNRFFDSGSIIRSKKPIYWCASCKTALAEAEVEYHDHRSPSIYVKFPVRSDLSAIDPALAGDNLSVVIWTTTPWTLPANLAVAFHPEYRYAAVALGNERLIMAHDLVERVMGEWGIEQYTIEATFSAVELEHKYCRHPFMERDSLLVLADYVTLEAGTGCVHTAPGHGSEDYQTGLRYGLDILSPVDDDGVYTDAAGVYAGRRIPAVNDDIIEECRTREALVSAGSVDHSYPHCWRCKQPVMYRATPQWFISMEKNDLREKALAQIKQVQWTPRWGMQRIYDMVEHRPDWCLSRQRTWGVPITVITCQQCHEPIKDRRIYERIDEIFTKEGADGWFARDIEDFLPADLSCPSCGSGGFAREQDILDVWFDSGVSYAAVCETRPELQTPADLYLEGSDQHRGWFHSALLASVGTRAVAPYKGVLTHGYVVDGQGKKMSKSVGNVVAPQEVIEKFGAEILRLWVASEDYRDDVKVSDDILRQISDSYRKIRNTIRFMLGNLFDFAPDTDAVAYAELDDLDRWALARFEELKRHIVEGYRTYSFHTIYHRLHYFCTTTMSALYLDICKDRLYASAPGAKSRRSVQTTLSEIVDGLLRLMAPILCFTASEAWDSLRERGSEAGLEGSVYMQEFPPEQPVYLFDEQTTKRWEQLLTIRAGITKALEAARVDKVIGHPLEAAVTIVACAEIEPFITEHHAALKELAVVSELYVEEADSTNDPAQAGDGLLVNVAPAEGEKCERCWIRSTTVGEQSDHPTICSRCYQVVINEYQEVEQ